MIDFFPARTFERVNRLQDYLEPHVLGPRGFICRHASACQASHRGQFYEGQLHHVGRNYDLALGSKPARVMVVGQEYGHNTINVSLEDRYDMIAVQSGQRRRFKAGSGFPARNPHMRGTTSVLRIFFGKEPGPDYEGEFLPSPKGPIHIFDAFALVNFLLCSAVPADRDAPSPERFVNEKFRGAARGRSNSAMQRNCAAHFRAAVEILEPDLMIVQGVMVRQWMMPVLNSVRSIAHNLEAAVVGRHSTLVASFSNPAAYGDMNWGVNADTPYLRNVIRPTIRRAREILLGAPHPA